MSYTVNALPDPAWVIRTKSVVVDPVTNKLPVTANEPVIIALPFTCNDADGVVVPIPTRPDADTVRNVDGLIKSGLVPIAKLPLELNPA